MAAMELTAYCLPLRKRSVIIDPKVVTLKNGRKAVTGKAKENPKYRVMRILTDAEASDLEKTLK